MATTPSEEYISVKDINLDELLAELRADHIFTTNSKLESSIRPLVDDAAGRGIDNLTYIAVDRDPTKVTDLMNLARHVVDINGGTAIVRSPSAVQAASDTYPRAALDTAQFEMMEHAADYPLGLNNFLSTLSQWTTPWVIPSLAVGLVIVVVFAALIAYWFTKAKKGSAA